MTFFVGRQHEIARIESAIGADRNVILRGKFGIGRTAIVKELAGRHRDEWTCAFADFSANGSDICASILRQLSIKRRDDLTARQLARAIASYAPKRRRKTIIVLDDVMKVTRQKLDLIRRLHASPSLLFIAIAERFVSEDAIMSLRVALDPAVVVAVDHLDEESSIRFFSYHARRLGLSWSRADIEMLARTMHGYPLEMAHIIVRLQHGQEVTR